MKAIVVILLLFVPMISSAQKTFVKAPQEYKKIYFTYEVKSNYIVEEQGFFADTLLLKMDFPDIKYTLKPNPEDVTENVAYVAFDQMTKEDRKRLSGALAHCEKNIYGVYNLKKNRVTLKHDRTRMDYEWESFIEYKTMDINQQKPMLIKDMPEKVVFDDVNKLSGTFKKKSGDKVFENVIIFDETLPRYVTTDDAFFDGNYGVRKIITLYSTTELKSVTYK